MPPGIPIADLSRGLALAAAILAMALADFFPVGVIARAIGMTRVLMDSAERFQRHDHEIPAEIVRVLIDFAMMIALVVTALGLIAPVGIDLEVTGPEAIAPEAIDQETTDRAMAMPSLRVATIICAIVQCASVRARNDRVPDPRKESPRKEDRHNQDRPNLVLLHRGPQQHGHLVPLRGQHRGPHQDHPAGPARLKAESGLRSRRLMAAQ